MDIHEALSSDGQVLVALCSGFALPSKDEGRKSAPFTISAWNQLARQVQNSALKRPAALQGLSSKDLVRELSIPEGDAERITKLLGRAARLALELESLFARGMWAVTRADEAYPRKLKANLKAQAPTVLFGAGDIQLLRHPAVGIVGSRNLDETAAAFARHIGRKVIESGMAVVSGGARGTDRLGMEGALDAGGLCVGVLADSLERTVGQPDLRQLLLDGKLAFVTPYIPTAGFSVGGAMGRNKIIYGLSDYTVVVSSEFQTGGTWAGATEALKTGSAPVFVRESPNAPNGNRELIKVGATAFPESELADIHNLAAWLQQNTRKLPVEGDLFSQA